MLERFRIVTQTYAASFSIKKHVFLKPTTFYMKTREKYAKQLVASEKTLKIKALLPFLLILLMSGVMSKQKILHEIKIVQYF